MMRENKLIAPCLVVLTVIAVAAVLKIADDVFLPLVMAWLIAYVIAPVFSFFDRRRCPKFLTALLAGVILLLLFVSLSVLFSTYVSNIADAVPQYAQVFMTIVKDISQKLNVDLSVLNRIDWPHYAQKAAMALMSMTLDFTTATITTLFFLVFILSGRRAFGQKVQKASFGGNAEHLNVVLGTVNRQIGQYLRLMTLISAMTGISVWLALRVLGVDFAAAWGGLAFFLNFIPNVGSILASIPPIVIAFIQFYPEFGTPILASLAILFVQVLFGNVVGPKLMGKSLDLSPTVILFFLLLWAWIWGAAGALLSVPIAVIVKIVCDNVTYLQPIGVLLSAGK